ncbi:alpha/beta hydrolase [Endozoicomonas sp. G2_1]|uniref:alpha/beta hydrolase n=1 Tax=Endozoicomonas sp. G2_1 TaxID=2821091 RepID=UPI001ADABF2C|nr:alpha/beta hydrolase [Endozoicomonas sp. G2_1]MBO9491621.1 alpha/beta hydrolase [Endozoicomonas sp. G2_1]
MKTFTVNTRVGDLAANLYLPEQANQTGQKPPVVIVTGAWTTVKEQMPAVYAKALAENGFAALTFDFRGWGASADSIQYLEDPARKTEDIRAVITAVKSLAEVDSSKIFGLGVCASAGYMLDAVAQNTDVSGAASVAPWLHNRELADQIYGGEASVSNLIELGEEAKASNGVFIEAASVENENALMYQAPYYTEQGRGLIPEYDNLFNVASWKPWLTYDAISPASNQDKPVLLVASQAMALPAGTEQYLAKANTNADNNVSVLWLDDVSQFDFYDVEQHVNTATKAVAEHFNAVLAS